MIQRAGTPALNCLKRESAKCQTVWGVIVFGNNKNDDIKWNVAVFGVKEFWKQKIL
jgi:hypothetical protein